MQSKISSIRVKKELIIKVLIILLLIYMIEIFLRTFYIGSSGTFIALSHPVYDFGINTIFGIIGVLFLIIFMFFRNNFKKVSQIIILILFPVLLIFLYYITLNSSGDYKYSHSIFNKFDNNGIIKEQYLDYYDENCRGGKYDRLILEAEIFTCSNFIKKLRKDKDLIIKTFEDAKYIGSIKLYHISFNGARNYGFEKISEIYKQGGEDKFEKMKQELLKIPTVNKAIIE